jgi:hypothetical protein
MEVIVAIISLALSIFVLVAIGKLFSINRNLEQLVKLAKRAESRLEPAAAPDPNTAPIDMTDDELMAKWKNTGFTIYADILKSRGYHMG